MKMKENDATGRKRRKISKLYIFHEKNMKTKVVQFFGTVRTDWSRLAGKKHSFFPVIPGWAGPVTHIPGSEGACRWRR